MEKCNFTSFRKCTCSSVLQAVDSFSFEEQAIFLTSCSIFPVSSCDKFICSNHENVFRCLYKQRLKSRRCSAPDVISSHTGNSCKAERHLSVSQVKSVFQKTGIVLPVGIGLCAQCRKKTLKSSTQQTQKDDEDVDIGQNKNITTVTESSLEEEPSIKRRRTQVQKQQTVDVLTDYDYCLSSECSQETDIHSQSSYTSYSHKSQLEGLNDYLSLFGSSPVKELKNPLCQSSDRTKQRYVTKAMQCVEILLETMCPKEGDVLWESMISTAGSKKNEDTSQRVLKEMYMNASTWQFRRQVLSILTQHMSLNEAQKFIPGLTSWKYYEAKKHCSEIGVGLPMPSLPLRRERVIPESLEHFIDFITSSHIIKDIPFGQRTLKMESGEVLEIPNVVRSLTSGSLINQYFQLCEEEDISPIGKSTLYKILSECPASVRKSLEGLDNYVMEGSRAFQTLEEILEEHKAVDLKAKLIEAKRYLKTDFKVHLDLKSEIHDHCMGFALSLSQKNFKLECDHLHTQRCTSCVEVDAVLAKVKDFVCSKDMSNKDSVLFKVEKAVNNIKDLQKHILRSKNQERTRPYIVEQMEDGDAIITADWAMKFLPRKYREGQMDWFAKRGINWHVSVTLLKTAIGFKSLTHIHLFAGQTPQDAAFTAAVLKDVVDDLRGTFTNLKRIHFFSDNAGCYKSTLSITTLRAEIGEQLATYNFCEAQNGKGPCDRRASHAKAAIRRYINEGKDVTSAEDMKKALDKVSHGSFKVKVVDGVLDLDREINKSTIPGISSYYNFQYTEEGIRIWQAFGIGEGKLLKWADLKPTKNHVHLKNITPWTKVTDAPDLSGLFTYVESKGSFCDTHVCYNGGTCRKQEKDCVCTVGFHEGYQCLESAMEDGTDYVGLKQRVVELQFEGTANISVNISVFENILDDGYAIFTDHIQQNYTNASTTMIDLFSMVTTLIEMAFDNLENDTDITIFIDKTTILGGKLLEEMNNFGSNSNCSDYDATEVYNTILNDTVLNGTLLNGTETGLSLLNLLMKIDTGQYFVESVKGITSITISALDYLNKASCMINNNAGCCVNHTNINFVSMVTTLTDKAFNELVNDTDISAFIKEIIKIDAKMLEVMENFGSKSECSDYDTTKIYNTLLNHTVLNDTGTSLLNMLMKLDTGKDFLESADEISSFALLMLDYQNKASCTVFNANQCCVNQTNVDLVSLVATLNNMASNKLQNDTEVAIYIKVIINLNRGIVSEKFGSKRTCSDYDITELYDTLLGDTETGLLTMVISVVNDKDYVESAKEITTFLMLMLDTLDRTSCMVPNTTSCCVNSTNINVVSVMTTLVNMASVGLDNGAQITLFVEEIIKFAVRIIDAMESFGSQSECADYDTTTMYDTLLSNTGGASLLNMLKKIVNVEMFLKSADAITQSSISMLDYLDRTSCRALSSIPCCVNHANVDLVHIPTSLVDSALITIDKMDDATTFMGTIIPLIRKILEVMESFGSKSQCTDYNTDTVFNALVTNTGTGLLKILLNVDEETYFLTRVKEITSFSKSFLDYLNRTSCMVNTNTLCCATQTQALKTILDKVVAGIVDTTDVIAGKCSSHLDVTDIAIEIYSFLIYEIDLMKVTYCGATNDTSTCRMTRQQALSVMTPVESILKQISKLALDRGCVNIAIPKLLTVQYISIAVLQATGKKVPDVIATAFTSLKMPFWETFQITYRYTEMIVYIISYKDTSISFASNVNSQDSAYIKSIVLDMAGKELTLSDPDDTTEVQVGSNDGIGSYWGKMKIHNITLGTFTCTGVPMADSTDMLLEIRFDTGKPCITLGSYGIFTPEDDVHDFLIETQGNDKILQKKVPKDLVYTFEDGVLKLSFTKAVGKNSLQTVVVRTHCAGNSPTTHHDCRAAVSNLRIFDELTQTWIEDPTLQFYKSDSSGITFKSSFFGTMSANVFFYPPEIIDLSAFTRFSELLNQPYGLAVISALVGVFILLTIPLRRLDNKDSVMWSYLPLADNTIKGRFIYYVSVHTDIMSAKEMTATIYFEVKGKNGKSRVRILSDNERKNFYSGTCSNFIMKTEFDMGDLREIRIWHDGTGNSPRWLLNRITITRAVTNMRYVFMCGQWLSLDCEDGRTWRRLKVSKTKGKGKKNSFIDSAKQRLFEDHLWLSLFKRPQYSRFSRVQRLWTVAALLFLTMLTSAMWYTSGDEAEGRSFSIGPFKLSYKQFSVGTMSAAICILPSLIIVAIFANRGFRQNKQNPVKKNVSDKSCLLPWWFVFVAYGIIFLCIGSSITFVLVYCVQWGETKALAWLLSFFFGAIEDVIILQPIKVVVIAVVIAALCNGLKNVHAKVTAPPDIKNEYDLEGNSKVAFEDLESVSCTIAKFVNSDYLRMARLLEFTDTEIRSWNLKEKLNGDEKRAKAVIGHWLYKNKITSCVFTDQQFMKLASVMQDLNQQEAVEWLFTNICIEDDVDSSVDKQRNRIFECPNELEEGQEIINLRKRLQLDRRLFTQMMRVVLRFAYAGFIALLLSHNTISISYLQNNHLITSVKGADIQPSTKEDIYLWIKNDFIPSVFPVLWAPDTILVRPTYYQHFFGDAYNKRLGLVRMRQVRVKEGCDIDEDLVELVHFCTNSYSIQTEGKVTYCKGWQSYNSSCADTEEDYVNDAFKYSTEDETKSLPYMGQVAIYSGAGYAVDIGPKQSLALEMVDTLELHNWINVYTRALFVEVISFNANTQLFSHLRIVFEQTSTGGWHVTPGAWSSNLYPYAEQRDYIILAAQLIFVIIAIIQIFVFFINVVKQRKKCCFSLNMWMNLFVIVLSVSAVAMYVLRIMYTIDAVEELFNEYEEGFVSFETVYIYDQVYIVCLSVILFVAMIDVMKPLTFNYYLHLMLRSVAISRVHIATYVLMVAVPIFAFACLMHLLIGSTVADFRSIHRSYLALWVLLLNMFKFSKSIDTDNLEVKVIFGCFTLFISIVLVNVFVAILNDAFTEVKSSNISTFDNDLNNHFWRKIEGVFMKLGNFKGNAELDKNTDNKYPLKLSDIKFDFLDDIVSELDKELRLCDKLVTVNTCRSQPQTTTSSNNYKNKGKQRLRGTLKQQSNTDICIYNQSLDSLEIHLGFSHCSDRLSVPYVCNKIHTPDIVADEQQERIFEFEPTESQVKGPVLLKIFDSQTNHVSIESSYITVSYDNLKSTEIYSATKSKEASYGTGVMLRGVPTNVVVQHKVLDHAPSDIFQMFAVSSAGCILRPKGIQNISLRLQPETVQRTCKIYIKVQPSPLSASLQIISASEDVTLPTQINIPRTGPLKYADDDRQLIVLTKEENSVWKDQHINVGFDGHFFYFTIAFIKKCIKTSILVKESEINQDKMRENTARTMPDGTVDITVENVIQEIEHHEDFLARLGLDNDKIKKWQSMCQVCHKHTVTSMLLKNWIVKSNDQTAEVSKIGDIVENLGHSQLADWIREICTNLEKKEKEIWELFKKICNESKNVTWEHMAYELGVYDELLKHTEQSMPKSEEENRFCVLLKWHKQNQALSLIDIKMCLKEKIPELKGFD